ncbi:hypothetical protein K7432_010607 [Basidiobolus ranarum]|uniref:Uncharacterized protein n=1 Tax=Basidiobolus ranarum TaxID=34480 RepID=A0ABR2VV63_9FUNG
MSDTFFSLHETAKTQLNYSNGILIVYCVVFCLYITICYRLMMEAIRAHKEIVLYICTAASVIGTLTSIYILSLFFIFNTSCSLRSLLSNVASGVVSACTQGAICIWVYRVIKCRAILVFGFLLSIIKFILLIHSLVSVAQYYRVVGLCTFRNGPFLLYYSILFDNSIITFFLLYFLLTLLRQRKLLLREKESMLPAINDPVIRQLQKTRSAAKVGLLALLFNVFATICIVVIIILAPDGKLAVVTFHLCLGLTFTCIANSLLLLLQPVVESRPEPFDNIPSFEMGEEYSIK